MPEKQRFYDVSDYGDRLEAGSKLKIEHSISNRDNGTRLAQLTHMSAEKLAELRAESAGKEETIYKKLRAATGEWEVQAAQTMLLDDAIEYVKTPPVKHTSNQWVAEQYGCECSNMVYKMVYSVREESKYNHSTKQQDVVAWVVDWRLYYNFPQHNRGGGNIAGQERKKFTEKEKADNYIIGRIAAFSDYFKELSPPVPANLAWKFSRNGQLLPGYSVQGKAPPPVIEASTPAPKVEPAPVPAKDAVPALPAGALAPTPTKDGALAPAHKSESGPAKDTDAGATDYSRFIRKKTPKAAQKKKASFAR